MKGSKLRRILCPVNLSESSRRIVEGAWALASLHGAELRLFHAGSDSGDERDAERLIASMFALTRRLPERTRVSAALAYGDPAFEIAQHARLARADLIVLGIDRRPPPARVSTIAADVATQAPCPVLLVQPHLLPSPSDRVAGFAEVLCCAGSLRGSNEGHEYAHILARLDHSRITHVDVLGTNEEIDESTERVPSNDGSNHIVHVSLMGSAGPEIVALARRTQSDLIVMGAVDGVPDLEPGGSTTAYLIQHAPCTVLIVPSSSTAAHAQTHRSRGCDAEGA